MGWRYFFWQAPAKQRSPFSFDHSVVAHLTNIFFSIWMGEAVTDFGLSNALFIFSCNFFPPGMRYQPHYK